MSDTKVAVKKLDNHLIITQSDKGKFFISGEDTIIISITNLSALLKFLLYKKFLSPKVLEGVLNEYYNRNT